MALDGNTSNDFPRDALDDVPVTAGNAMQTQRRSKHCYAGKAALCWEIGTTKSGEPTVFLQACPAVSEKVYNWKAKITVQLSIEEMRQILMVILHYQKNFKATAHGQNNDKGFEVEDQGAKLFVKVFQAKDKDGKGGGMFAVPVTTGDAFVVADVLIEQLLKCLPGCKNGMDVINLARMVMPKAA